MDCTEVAHLPLSLSNLGLIPDPTINSWMPLYRQGVTSQSSLSLGLMLSQGFRLPAVVCGCYRSDDILWTVGELSPAHSSNYKFLHLRSNVKLDQLVCERFGPKTYHGRPRTMGIIGAVKLVVGVSSSLHNNLHINCIFFLQPFMTFCYIWPSVSIYR